MDRADLQRLGSHWLRLLACVALLGPATAGAVVWDFESGGSQGWIASSGVTAVPVIGGAAGSKSLRISGLQPGAWTYARAPLTPVQEGHYYRLSFWVRVNQLSDAGGQSVAYVPYLKCGFFDVNGVALPAPLFTAYERERATLLETWSFVEVEFEAPPGARNCLLDVQKGVMTPLQVDMNLDQVTLEEVDEQELGTRFALPSSEAGVLQQYAGVHPRLFLTQQRIAELSQAIQPGGPLASMWFDVKAIADTFVAWTAQQLADKPLSPPSSDLQLWQRQVGNAMPYLALAYRLTGDPTYLQAAERFANASISFLHWGVNHENDPDLAGAHQLFGLATIYDWCYDDLQPATRDSIRDELLREGHSVFQNIALYAVRDRSTLHNVWWEHAYLNNHMMVNVAALGAAGLAVFDAPDPGSLSPSDPAHWAGMALDKLRKSQEVLLGTDGAYHEGLGYWAYGLEYTMKFSHLARDLLGVDDLYDHPWLRQAVDYRLYLSLPRNAWNCAAEHLCSAPNQVVDFADGPRGNWYGPDYLLRGLAGEYQNPVAQWLAQALDNAGGTDFNGPESRWLNLLWADTSLPGQSPASLPTMRHFQDNGIVAMRSDWSGNESLVVLKSAPPLGHYWLNAGYPNDEGSGHGHPDANNFVIFGAGEWILREGGNQEVGTDRHNTLLIRNNAGQWQGQLPVKTAVERRVAPRVLAASPQSLFDYAVADATEAYDASLGLQRFIRHAVFVKPGVLVVIDDLELSQAREIELRFHPERVPTLQPDGSSTLSGCSPTAGQPLPKACTRVSLLTPQTAGVSVANLPPEGNPSGTLLQTIRVAATTSALQTATAFSWSQYGSTPAAVTLVEQVGSCWRFSVGTEQIDVDIAAKTAEPAQGACGPGG